MARLRLLINRSLLTLAWQSPCFVGNGLGAVPAARPQSLPAIFYLCAEVQHSAHGADETHIAIRLKTRSAAMRCSNPKSDPGGHPPPPVKATGNMVPMQAISHGIVGPRLAHRIARVFPPLTHWFQVSVPLVTLKAMFPLVSCPVFHLRLLHYTHDSMYSQYIFLNVW